MPRKIVASRNSERSLFRVHVGDARDLDSILENHSSPATPLITCTITSPPYANLKDYGHADQIGTGQSYDDYLAELRKIFESVLGHTKPDGSMWVIADTFRPKEDSTLSRLELLPFQLAEQATAVGWILQDVIIWEKDKTLPWSSKGRLRNKFEYIMFFVKGPNFKYYVDRVRGVEELKGWWVRWPERYNPQGKVPSNLWKIPIPVQGSWANTKIQHMCPLPPDLVERLIQLSSDEGDVVLDPFAGSGVVVAEAERLRRRGLGIELLPKFVAMFDSVVRQEILQRSSGSSRKARTLKSEELKDVILKLRTTKYPKVLIKGLLKRNLDVPYPVLAVVLLNSTDEKRISKPYKLIEATCFFVIKDGVKGKEELCEALEAVSVEPPASKFGVDADIRVVHWNELMTSLGGKRLHLYMGGQTYSSKRTIAPKDLREIARESREGAIPPIASNVELHEEPDVIVSVAN